MSDTPDQQTIDDINAIKDRLVATPVDSIIQPMHAVMIDGEHLCRFGALDADGCRLHVADLLYQWGFRADHPAIAAVDVSKSLRD